ncbi:MAG TPA: hypothetical protein VK629_18655 [Steroidobacteraceae bacterium]|nr:hypothetical protein [Steroidobacteraceae bacterium]
MVDHPTPSHRLRWLEFALFAAAFLLIGSALRVGDQAAFPITPSLVIGTAFLIGSLGISFYRRWDTFFFAALKFVFYGYLTWIVFERVTQ